MTILFFGGWIDVVIIKLYIRIIVLIGINFIISNFFELNNLLFWLLI